MKRQKTGYELEWDENEPGFEFNPGFKIWDAIVVWFSSAVLLIASSVVFIVITIGIIITTCGLHCSEEFPVTETIFDAMETWIENPVNILISLTLWCILAVYLLKLDRAKAVGFTTLATAITAIVLHGIVSM